MDTRHHSLGTAEQGLRYQSFLRRAEGPRDTLAAAYAELIDRLVVESDYVTQAQAEHLERSFRRKLGLDDGQQREPRDQNRGGSRPPPNFSKKRTFQPVRRNSLPSGTFERTFFRPITRAWANRYKFAVEKLSERLRKPGEREGELGRIAVAVAKLMASFAAFSRNGRLDMSLNFLASALNRGRSSIVRAINELVALGLVEKQRRLRPAQGDDGRNVEQDTNVYRLVLTAAAAALLAPLGAAPVPDDAAAARAATMANIEEEIAAMSPEDWARTEIESDALAAATARLRREGDALKAERLARIRESHGGSESQLDSLLREESGTALARGKALGWRPAAAKGLSGGSPAQTGPAGPMRRTPG